MAKKISDETPNASGISPDNLRRVVGEISRQKKNASEYAGLAGKATQNAVEQYGLDKVALTLTRRLADMEDGKRQSVIRASISYFDKMGFFEQADAFDDLIGTLEGIVERARGRNARKPDEALSSLAH